MIPNKNNITIVIEKETAVEMTGETPHSIKRINETNREIKKIQTGTSSLRLSTK